MERYFESAKYIANSLKSNTRYDLNGKQTSEMTYSQKMFMRITANDVLNKIKARDGVENQTYINLSNAVEPFNQIKREKKKAENRKKKLKKKEKTKSIIELTNLVIIIITIV